MSKEDLVNTSPTRLNGLMRDTEGDKEGGVAGVIAEERQEVMTEKSSSNFDETEEGYDELMSNDSPFHSAYIPPFPHR